MALWNLKPHKKKSQSRPLRSLPTVSQPRSETPKSAPAVRRKAVPSSVKKIEQQTNPRKEFLDIFGRFSHSRSRTEIWRDFIVMAACSISNAVDNDHFDERESLYLSIIKKYPKVEQEFFPKLFACVVIALELNPNQDFLGELFMTLNLSNSGAGQFFTPYHVCELMAKTTMSDLTQKITDKGYVTINDPCCGAGATLVAGINEAREILSSDGRNYQNHIFVVAQDIDMAVAMMCYIQISLLGVAGYVKVGNSLTNPITTNDKTENYWFTPMYFSDIWTLRRIFQKL